ncbi:ABC transporter ATP-binding protein [Sedimentitalea todarodis]|uniref:Glutathione import ATP-binding protein GsiA n=1 Tax=Sedimentitalea todarodis TaxID=1631240 RepID=A0ABU3VF43_9RHOB|nr:ABC transporter ATP-binding protein [Sedimentitalea todarodis]MDU9004788.1 ABC transporter ATP-binding protein [Sedimentitalea todarodis]
MIDVSELNVTFGQGRSELRAVQDVSFRIEAGESFGLVGESGSGKSTVLRAISRLTQDWTGSIKIAGAELEHRRDRKTTRRMQMVFQDPYGSLHPRHTINDILMEPLEIHRMDRREARVLTALEDVGLGIEMRFRYPYQISGGQRQRIAIARALILEPEILLLDEPTSALDVSVQAEILNLLKRIQRERGLTYLMVSHDLAVVAHMCERVAVMNRGRFAEVLTTEQLRSGTPKQDYTRQLLTASGRYDRDVAKSFVSFD